MTFSCLGSSARALHIDGDCIFPCSGGTPCHPTPKSNKKRNSRGPRIFGKMENAKMISPLEEVEGISRVAWMRPSLRVSIADYVSSDINIIRPKSGEKSPKGQTNYQNHPSRRPGIFGTIENTKSIFPSEKSREFPA